MLLGVLAGLREVIDLPVRAEQSVACVLGIDQRALAALARRGKYHTVVIVRSGGRVDFPGDVGHVALPWQQRFAEHLGSPCDDRAVGRPRFVAFRAAAHEHGHSPAFASAMKSVSVGSSCGCSGYIALSSWNHVSSDVMLRLISRPLLFWMSMFLAIESIDLQM